MNKRHSVMRNHQSSEKTIENDGRLEITASGGDKNPESVKGHNLTLRLENPIYLSELNRLNVRYVTFSEETAQDEVVLKGMFHHHFDRHGLSVHAGNLIEMANRTSFAELPPAISMTILFDGKVSFSLGSQRYQLGCLGEGSVECSAFIINQPEMLSRHFERGMHVNKLNIFIERQWLEERATTPDERQHIQQLFHDHATFYHWQASDTVAKLASDYLFKTQHTSLQDELLKEAIIFQLIAENLKVLTSLHQAERPQKTDQLYATASQENQLRHQIDDMIMQSMTVTEMASAIGLSVSTLQRKFKTTYGVTVNNYCRQRRLDMAKRALLVEKKSIGEAAFIAGYGHPSNFITAFKKRFKLTPSELVATTFP
jgi:AraC-like DNA-binding protein